ncbi:UNVERIFIED_CONTAM: hypothetical protein PYX00_002999 [Menopon gallinae]
MPIGSLMKMKASVLLIFVHLYALCASEEHPRIKRSINEVDAAEYDQEFWLGKGQDILLRHLVNRPNLNIAKNVIFFIGDGMSLQTITAARIYKEQKLGERGEEGELSFEEFPYTGLAKTYCVDSQVGDSACTATAYLGGVKGNEGTIGVSAAVGRMDCLGMRNESNHVLSLAKWAQDAGKSTGLVTTTRVTHASPAGLYAHVSERGWEEDGAVSSDGFNSVDCPDIAQQLIFNNPGKNINVIMGGGRRNFFPYDKTDSQGHKGRRRDGQNLIELWKLDKIKKNASYAYVTNRSELLSLKFSPQYLLGLFSPSHMEYHLEEKTNEPTLEEMTVAAIKHLQKNPRGYFLFVEGGKIDLAHHENMARKALDETVEFSKAVAAAVRASDERDTLIVVTADHAHVMTMNGYPRRGNDILGLAGEAPDGLPYSTLSYANGPGSIRPDGSNRRQNLRQFNLYDKSFKYPSMVPLPIETHGGDDVVVYARGPWSHLFSGAYEQNFIPHAVGYAACLGKGMTACYTPIRGDRKPIFRA